MGFLSLCFDSTMSLNIENSIQYSLFLRHLAYALKRKCEDILIVHTCLADVYLFGQLAERVHLHRAAVLVGNDLSRLLRIRHTWEVISMIQFQFFFFYF